jgi:hypothetical protein
MRRMFCHAENFNQPLNKWNVSKVKDMCCMFEHAKKFNQSLNNWNVSNVANAAKMFAGATCYSHSMSNWKFPAKCDVFNFLNGCVMWCKYNTKADMPSKGKTKLPIPMKIKRYWKKLK